jgi:hypothetical protein
MPCPFTPARRSARFPGLETSQSASRTDPARNVILSKVDSAEKVARGQNYAKQLHRQRVRCQILVEEKEDTRSILEGFVSGGFDFFSRT